MKKIHLLNFFLFCLASLCNGQTTQTITVPITVTTDDALENNNGTIDNTIGALYLGGSTSYKISGFRFSNINLPNEATVVSAYIKFSNYGSLAASNVEIKAQRGDASPLTTAAYNISSRTYTSSSVNWAYPVWQPGYTILNTPSLTPLINEIRAAGWGNSQSILFKFTGTQANSCAAVFTSNTASQTPNLVITYTMPVVAVTPITDVSKMDSLVVNEVSSQGSAGITDDWIELHNMHNRPLKITGNVFISDKNSNPTLAEITNLEIPAKGYAIIIADGTSTAGQYNIPFGMSSDGESLYLSRRVNGVVSELNRFTFGAQVAGQSHGRYPNGTGPAVKFSEPTFKGNNASGKQSYDLVFSHNRGLYPSAFNLSITVPAGATVRYTKDGTTPTSSVGTVYSGPINVNATAVYKFYAYGSNGNSQVESKSYILKSNYGNEVANIWTAEWILKNNISATDYANALAQIPIVSVSSPSSELTANWQLTNTEYIDNHVYPGRANFESKSTSRKFGLWSLAYYNSGVKTKFNKDAGEEVKKAKYPFFDADPNDRYTLPSKFQTLELKEGQDGAQKLCCNIGYLRYTERAAMKLHKQMGMFGLETRFVNFFYNGKYRGLKTLRNDFKSQNLEEVFGGNDEDYTKVSMKKLGWSGGVVESGDGDPAIWSTIMSAKSSKNLQTLKSYVDIENLIKFQILYMMLDTEDEAVMMIHNTPSDQTLKGIFILDDTDGGFFGGVDGPSSSVPLASTGVGAGYTSKLKWTASSSYLGPGGIFGAFAKNPWNPTNYNLEFNTKVKDAVLKNIGPTGGNYRGAANASLSVDNLTSVLTACKAEVDLVYKLDAAYMGAFSGIYESWKNTDNPRIINQLPERVRYNLEKWESFGLTHTLQPVVIANNNAQLTITNPNAGTQTYYTLNGTDPMGDNGIVAANAVLYSSVNPATLPNGTHTIVSRAFTNNNWGPITTKQVDVYSAARMASSISYFDDIKDLKIGLYPNPTVSKIKVDLTYVTDLSNTVLKIMDMNGKVVYENNKLNDKVLDIDVAGFSPGTYIIQSQIGQNIKTTKFVKAQ